MNRLVEVRGGGGGGIFLKGKCHRDFAVFCLKLLR